jgi:hypothetical protein
MRRRRQDMQKDPETGEKPVSKFGDVAPLAHDPDDQPTREDREGHGSPFAFPVPLPRILRPRGRWKRRD